VVMLGDIAHAGTKFTILMLGIGAVIWRLCLRSCIASRTLNGESKSNAHLAGVANSNNKLRNGID
jgi:hypothetical protein